MRILLRTSALVLLVAPLAACDSAPLEPEGSRVHEALASTNDARATAKGATGALATASPAEGALATIDDTEGTVDTAKDTPAESWSYDLLETDLELDVANLRGKAALAIAAPGRSSASFEIGDLTIHSVTGKHGPLAYTAANGKLHVAIGRSYRPVRIEVEYTFKGHNQFDGWDPSAGVSFLWPYFCGNLFPCKSSPSDGVRFRLHVTGAPEGSKAIYPTNVPGDAPSYMPAIAVGDFTEIDLGSTLFGTRVKAWHLPGQEADTARGTAHLRNVFDFYERTYGRYTFGKVVGSVSANWGPGDYGGMEHHPYWHVAKGSMYNEETHAHEAAHGWFGNGVRVACWEDFVLSEGTTTYLAAHALKKQGVDVWPSYECRLKARCDADQASTPNTIALPDTTCNQIDLLHHPLWSGVPYYKGAYFYRKVAELIGEDRLDRALAHFYARHRGEAARMEDLLQTLKWHAPSKADAIEALANGWLRSFECPDEWSTLCPSSP
ncbi:M1 family metallopeptidase [Pendulispora albinea]|uniref:Peptidase M1 n=1 Tax=Pendulispora albinea TaxID=2741071 RepID=A0ABZ2M900_9BACT